MIAYLQDKGVTVEVPDDIGDKELADVQNNFSHYIEPETAAADGQSQPKPAAPSAAPTEPAHGNLFKDLPTGIPGVSIPTESIELPTMPKWLPNFYESYIKPGLDANPIFGLPDRLNETPEGRAFAGKAIDAFSFGLTKPIIDPMLKTEYKDHPVYGTIGTAAGGIGSLLATGGLLRVLGLGVAATEAAAVIPAVGEEGTVLAAATKLAPRFLPKAIMSGATFGTNTFINKTVKAFQDGNVDLAEFGRDVLLQATGGTILGGISGIANVPAAVASAAGLGFTMTKMEGGDNAEAALSAAIWAGFEAIGSFGGRSEALTGESIRTVEDTIDHYAHTKNPSVPPNSGIGKAIVAQEIEKLGGEEAVKSKEGALQLFENINQKVRQGKVPEPIQEVVKPREIETGVGGKQNAGAAEPIPGSPAPTSSEPQPIEQTPPDQPGIDPVREGLPNTAFPSTEVTSPTSISEHPDFLKMTDDATAVVKHYASQRGVEPTHDFARSLWQEMHDKLGEIMKAPAEKRIDVVNRIKAEHPDIEKEFSTLRDKIWSDTTDNFFNRQVAGKYGNMRPQVALDAEAAAVQPTPKESVLKFDRSGLPIRKPGSVVSTVDTIDGQKAKITHQMILDEAAALHQDAIEQWESQDPISAFVKENGGIKGFTAGHEAEEFKQVPIWARGITSPDEMAQMAYDAGVLEEPNSDFLMTHLGSLKPKGAAPALANFYSEAQHNLEGLLSGFEHGSTDFKFGENAAEKRVAYGDQTKTPEFKKWFGDSKVVDESGEPLTYYHSTTSPKQIQQFEKRSGLSGHFGTLKAAEDRMRQAREDGTFDENAPASIVPVYLSIQNPVRMSDVHFDNAEEMVLDLRDKNIISAKEATKLNVYDNEDKRFDMRPVVDLLKKKGYDGIVYENAVEDPGSDTYIPFEPTQIKSAIANEGSFDAKNPNILKEPNDSPVASPYQAELLPPEAEVRPMTADGFRAIKDAHFEVKYRKVGAVVFPKQKLSSPADLAFAFKNFSNPAQENFYLMALKKGRVVAVEHLGFGTIDQVAVYPVNVLNILDKSQADSAVICHNHPSGHVNPSEEDKRLTYTIRDVLKNHGVRFDGHVIIDDTKFGFIDPDGNVSEQTHAEYAKTQKIPLLQKYFEWKGERPTGTRPLLTSPKAVFELSKGIQLSSDKEGILWLLTVQNEILNAVVLPHGRFDPKTISKIVATYRPGGMITVNAGLDREAVQNLKAALKPLDVRYQDNVTVDGNKYNSDAEHGVMETPAEYKAQGAAEEGALFNPESENIADRYNRLRQQAMDQGMNPAQAAKWAKENLRAPDAAASTEPKTKQAEFDAGGVESFGKGKKGEPDMFGGGFSGNAAGSPIKPRIYPGRSAAKPAIPPETPAPKPVAQGLTNSLTEIRDLVVPANAAPLAGEIMRENLGQMARSYDKAETALEGAKRLFDSQSNAQNLSFIDSMERGEDQSTPELTAIAKALRTLLDDKRKEIQALGKGKLDAFIENYFPHIWDQGPDQVASAIQMAAKRPLEGSKSFLKKRTIEFTKDGVEAGLTPVSYNPVTLALTKIREMDKYLMAHKTLQDYQKNGLAAYVPVGKDVPEGFIKINDNISTIFKSPMIPIQEAFDQHVMDKLNDAAKNLGIDSERAVKLGGKKWGVHIGTEDEPGKIIAKFAGPESVLAHEIGHALDDIYGLQDKFLKNKTMNAELRRLADARFADSKTSDAYKKYVRKGSEKMAVMLEAYIHAPDLFKELAPTVFEFYQNLLKSDPKLKPLTEIKPSLVLGTAQSEVYAGGNVITGHIYAQKDAARIINNYLSPGLSKFATYRAYRFVGNAINQFQLGFSAFHLGFTTMDSAISKLALAMNQFFSGHPIEAIKEALQVPVAPVQNIIRGDKLMKAWRGEGRSPMDEIMGNAMAVAGGRARMDQFYATTMFDQMKRNFKEGAVIPGLLRIPLAIVELSSKPILEMIVPRMKLGVFADIMRMELENNPGMSHEQMRTIAQRAWNSVDNRMGQMVYDNLFWNRSFKDLLMASVRSVGWNLGTVREVGGGAVDTVKFIKNLATGKKDEFSYRMAYLFALTFLTGMVGSMYQYLRTGKGPKDAKDLFFPQTGGLDNGGDPQRVSLPTYMKDLYHYSVAPGKTVMNKLHPLLAMMAQMYGNKDFYGVKIRNEDDPLIKQILSEATYLAKQMEPFGLRNMQNNIGSGNKSMLDVIQPWIGITPAPYDINQTDAEKIAHRISAGKVAIGGRTQAEADRSKLLQVLSREFAQDDPNAKNDLMEAYRTGKISYKQMEHVVVSAKMPPLLKQVRSFTYDELKAVYDKGTPEEKALLEQTLQRKKFTAENSYVQQPTESE